MVAKQRQSGCDHACWYRGAGRGPVVGLLPNLATDFRLPTQYHPRRDLITRATFEVPNELETNTLRDRRKREQLAFYSNRTEPLDQLCATLENDLLLVLGADSYNALKEDERTAFANFYEGDEEAPENEPKERFSNLKSVFAADPELKKLDAALKFALGANYRFGLIRAPQHSPEQGNQERIIVYPVGNPDALQFVEISDVRVTESGNAMAKELRDQFRRNFPAENYEVVAKMISDWIVQRLGDYETLSYNDERTETARQQAANNVDPVMTTYRAGESKLASAGTLLTKSEIDLLRREWETMVDNMHPVDRIVRVLAYAGMIAALYLLCATYIFFVDDRRLLFDRVRLAKLLTVMVVAISLGYAASSDQWRGELVPLVLASIICAVVYGRELALLLMAAASISLTLFLGADLSELVMMMAACFSCILLLGRIRTRTHLFFVGATSAAITMLTVIGVGIVTGNTMSVGFSATDLEAVYLGPSFNLVLWELIKSAVWAGFSIMLSASIMTPLLPFVEKAFGVQTDLSLLELGDASHPLLRRLAQRAPVLTTIPSMSRRSPKRRRMKLVPTDCWFASAPTFMTSAKCSSRNTSSKIRVPASISMIRCNRQ